MAGTLSSGRPGGNPDLKEYQYTAKGDEPLTEKLTLRLTPSMMNYLKSLGKDYPDFVRDAIAQKMVRHEAAATEPKTVTTELATAGQPQQHTQTNQEDQEQGTNPTLAEQEATPKTRRKAGQTLAQKPTKPTTQTRNRKNTATEKLTE